MCNQVQMQQIPSKRCTKSWVQNTRAIFCRRRICSGCSWMLGVGWAQCACCMPPSQNTCCSLAQQWTHRDTQVKCAKRCHMYFILCQHNSHTESLIFIQAHVNEVVNGLYSNYTVHCAMYLQTHSQIRIWKCMLCNVLIPNHFDI